MSSPLWPVVKRGLAGRCPACGQGALFLGYLKPVERCAACGENYSEIRADDGPAWLTILLVGHLLAPLMLHILPKSTWPEWEHMVAWPSAAFVLMLLLLPRAKGLFIGLIWRMKCP